MGLLFIVMGIIGGGVDCFNLGVLEIEFERKV